MANNVGYEMWDPYAHDILTFAARQYGDNSNQHLDITLNDLCGTALTGGGIPLTLDGFGTKDFSFSHHTRDDSFTVSGRITSLTLAAPVPEPETYAMLLAGIGMLAWRRKRAGARLR